MNNATSLIIEMILKIMNCSQQELANLLGVSRVTINNWINEGNISYESKQKISDLFSFPISFFNVSLDENNTVYRIMYSTIYNGYKKLNTPRNNENNRINEILNEIEADYCNDKEISDEMIIESLKSGYNPFTGEVFDDDHILNNPRVKTALDKISLKTNRSPKKDKLVTYEELNDEEKLLFNQLKHWRLEKTYEQGYYAPYIIFDNRVLATIAHSKIEKVEDLKNISGIGDTKYNLYGDEIYNIIIDFKNNNEDNNTSNNNLEFDNDVYFF